MRRRILIIAVLVVLLLAILFALLPPEPQGNASVALLGITNSLTGQRIAIIAFTNAGSLAVAGIPHTVDYKTAGTWLTHQPVPAVVNVDVAADKGIPVVLRPHESPEFSS